MNLKACFEKQIDDLFNRRQKDHAQTVSQDLQELLKKGGMLFPEELRENAILFIGINPAFDGNAEEKVIYVPRNHKPSDKKIPYFEAIYNLMKLVTTTHDWDHLDLLGVRETKMETVGKLLGSDTTFIHDHLMISANIIEMAQPKMMVVANTLARDLMGKGMDKIGNQLKGVWMGYEFKFDKNIGTDRIVGRIKEVPVEPRGANLIGTPVIFTSMLSGQRALDIGSRERLAWHIGFVLDRIG